MAFVPLTVALAKRKKSSHTRTANAIFLERGLKKLKGKETCFITNASGLGRLFLYDAMEGKGRHILDKLKKADVSLKRLFTPEHGLTGQEEDHGNTKTKAGAPETIYLTTVDKLQEKIKDCEAVVFDLPDSGVRPYTYRTVLNRLMRAISANKSGQFLYLIDVPNPASHLGAQGPVAQKSNFSYVGEEEIPFMPGFTHAEIARKFIHDHKLKLKIFIQRMVNYNPKIPHSKRGLPFYPPSPNLPNLRTNQCYWISVYFEATSIEEGRITKDPFCQIGHAQFENRELPVMGGVHFYPYPFFAASGKFKGKLISGYKLDFSETGVNPTRAAYEFFLWHIKHGKDGFMKKWLTEKQGLDAQTGTTTYRAALVKGLSYNQWHSKEKKKVVRFVQAMQKYRLYK